MLELVKNIEEGDRINRAVIGFILIVGSALGFGRYFMVLCGLVLIAEGAIGWCGIRALTSCLWKCCPMNKNNDANCDTKKSCNKDKSAE
jgi:hypothetical protein